LGLALLLVVTGLAGGWQQSRLAAGIDFYVPWVVVQSLQQEGPRPYETTSGRGLAQAGRQLLVSSYGGRSARAARAAGFHGDFVLAPATPAHYALLGPLVSGVYDLDYLRFQILSLLAVLAALVGLGHVAGLDRTTTGLLAAVVLLVFDPLMSDIRVGNVHRLLLAGLALFLFLLQLQRSWARPAAGALLAMLTLFKPLTVFAVLMVGLSRVLQGRVRESLPELIGGLVGASLVVGASWWVFGGLDCWSRWLSSVGALPDGVVAVTAGNYAPARVVPALGALHPAVLPVVLCSVVAVALVRGRQAMPGDLASRLRLDGLTLAAGLLVFLLGAPLVWLHYDLLALPAVFLLLGSAGLPARRAWGSTEWAVVGALALVGLQLPLQFLDLAPGKAQSAVVNMGLVLLFVVTIRELAGPDRRKALTP